MKHMNKPKVDTDLLAKKTAAIVRSRYDQHGYINYKCNLILRITLELPSLFLGQTGQNRVRNRIFCHFLEFGSLVFL